MRTRAIAFVLILSSLTLPISGRAQGPEDAAFANAIPAHGGAAVRNARTIAIIGASTSAGQTQPVKISASVDGKIRIDYGTPVRRSLVTTPSSRFEVVSGRMIPQPLHVGLFSQLDMLSVFGIGYLAETNSKKTTLGRGVVGGQATHKFKAESGRQQIHYKRVIRDEADIDFFENGLIAGIARRQYADRSLDLSFVRAYAFSDYRAVDGVMFPFRIEKFVDGILRETIVVHAVQINAPFSDAIFER